MAVGDNIGALGGLGSLTQDEFSDLSKGLQSTNNPIASVFGYDITPEKALTTAIRICRTSFICTYGYRQYNK
jgi:hypothetical protein